MSTPLALPNLLDVYFFKGKIIPRISIDDFVASETRTPESKRNALSSIFVPQRVPTFGLLIVIGVLAAVERGVRAAPVRDLDENLIFFENNQDENGYNFAYKTKDGQYREEQGVINPETGVLTVSGVYGYEGPDGKTYEYNYESDENGYRIVTKPPPIGFAPIPNAVLLSLVG
ncbi:cuticle protein CP14.6-like [Anopheles aquasalis]|uniref:cuticle protein CP14.6-like n=1 Tax=Anopheles aquasalis TaxID=42839 RepID=UPI00215AFD37|nr:cuticle protein CP14.6-like [Anopheles aquasalis]